MSYNNNRPQKSTNSYSIKPFRSYSQMDTPSALATFASLASAMDEIHNRNASTLSFEELYRNAYNLVLHKHGNLLYEGISERLVVHLRRCGGRLVRLALQREQSAATSNNNSNNESTGGQLLSTNTTNINNNNNNNSAMRGGESNSLLQYCLLEELSKAWTEHRITMVMIRDIFMYMDRTYVPQQRKRPVYDLGLWLFRRVVWERSMGDNGDEESDVDGEGGLMQVPPSLMDDSIMMNNNDYGKMMSAETLGNVASTLVLQVIHQDRLDRLDDAPQRLALLKSLVQMLLELAHASNGAYADAAASFRRGGVCCECVSSWS